MAYGDMGAMRERYPKRILAAANRGRGEKPVPGFSRNKLGQNSQDERKLREGNPNDPFDDFTLQ
uniref:Uncharacterized protein n=1 Tax=Candidatus Kentrum sp. LPFa TaxID=2126335 RepID=A0A450XYJ6_9GAMM|nr:MAG: hypothetical protein BECKLPF1236A_GA0070988_102413 [Candidatus Kentron sp. LPFa]VFK34371.1 MAG: hypothetical protein BECKLPF1236C_GA0070990_102652 [Candidatus Kentron sp. LPFa]